MRPLRCIIPVLVLAVGLSACRDEASRDSSDVTGPRTVRADAKTAAGCDVPKELEAAARDYFENPEQQQAQDAFKAMEEACSLNPVGFGPAVAAEAWKVMRLVDYVVNDAPDRAGDAMVGADLVTGLAQCIEDDGEGNICSYGQDDPTLAEVLCDQKDADQNCFQDVVEAALSGGTAGSFEVHGQDTENVVAREAIPFDNNGAIWGVSVGHDWSTVTGTYPDPVLVYGRPGGQELPSASDLGIPGYHFETFPQVDGFEEGQLHVWVCLQSLVTWADGRQKRLQRNNVLLELYPASLDEEVPECAGVSFQTTSSPLAASLAAPIMGGLRRLFPSMFSAPLFGQGISIGGTPINFSDFSGVGASTEGKLEATVGGQDFVGYKLDGVAGDPLSPIVVTTRSGDGTPIEKVRVWFTIEGNQGVPADAYFVDAPGGERVVEGEPENCTEEEANSIKDCTEEPDGSVTFDQIRIGKAGGYTICIHAALDDEFTFPSICSGISHIDNDTGN